MSTATRHPIIPDRVEMPALCPHLRRTNWEQVETGITIEAACKESWRCLQDHQQTCVSLCPVGINIPLIMEYMQKGWYRRAVDIFRDHNPLIGITGLVCPQNEQCELGCVVGHAIENGTPVPPVAIGAIERTLWEWERTSGGGPRLPTLLPENGKSVAVVGSGPAGLTAAATLRKLGYHVFLFEAFHLPGGVLVYGIPSFRLPKHIVKSEVDLILSYGGIELINDTFIGKKFFIEELRRDFDAVFFATGAGEPTTLGIPGQELPGAMTANEWLSRVNLMHGYDSAYETHLPEFNDAVIFGGGNVAMDAARSAKRVGGESNVTIAYRRSRDEMPARKVEIEHALEEGIALEELITPLRIIGNEKNDRVTGVECVRNKLGEPDASGRRRPVEIPDSKFFIPAELVITAIGQKPNPVIQNALPGILAGKGGNLKVDALGRTSVPGCFAGGDLGRGGATVILAMGDGKSAAFAIDQYLQGKWPWPTAEEFTPVT